MSGQQRVKRFIFQAFVYPGLYRSMLKDENKEFVP
jgi:hypothetical protein